jgi:hypothetical protein
MDRPVTNCPCLPPPQALTIPPNFHRHKQGRRSVPRPIRRTQRGLRRLIVIWLIFLDQDRWSNSVLPTRFGQGIKPPRRPNFAQIMHPNIRCHRSLARPNRTTPEYQDVNHGVAVGWLRQFYVIAPIASEGGMGRWCCRTCAGCVCGRVELCWLFFVPCERSARCA